MMLQLPSNITALACKGDLTLAAIAGGRITVAQRTHIIHTWDGHAGTVLQMLVMDKLLLSLGSDKYLKVWQLDVRSSTPMVCFTNAPFQWPIPLMHIAQQAIGTQKLC